MFCIPPQEDISVLKVAPSSKDTKAPEPAKVTITQVFDFAGEEVRYASEHSSTV